MRFFLLVLFVLMFGTNTSAASLSLEAEPLNAEAFSTVLVRAISFDLNLDQVVLEWQVNVEGVPSAKGNKSISINLGSPGSETVVTAKAKTAAGETITGSITFRPSTVALLIDADTHVPPFYRGLRLPSIASQVKLVAIPTIMGIDGKTLNPDTLSYRWTRNGRLLQNSSGVGRSSISLYRDSLTGNETVTVEVYDLLGNRRGGKEIVVRNEPAKAIIYPRNPLTGIRYNLSAQGEISQTGDLVLVAEPFFFPTASLREDLTFEWFVAEKPEMSTTTTNNTISLSVQDPIGLGLEIKDVSNPLRSARNFISIGTKK